MSPAMKKICGQLAKQRGTTAELIYQEMQKAIAEAYSRPQPEAVEAYRACIPRSGAVPTPEEMICFLCHEIQDGLQEPVSPTARDA